MTNKLSYILGRTCLKVVLEKSAFSTLLIFYFISCEVGRRTQPSSIHLNSQPYHSDTRWFRLILYDPYFKKRIIDLCDQTTSNKLTNLSSEEKRYEVFKCFRSVTCHRSWVEGRPASGAEICLFHGRVLEKTRLHKAI